MLSLREEIFEGSVNRCALCFCSVPRRLALDSDYLRLTKMRLRYNSPTLLSVFMKNWHKIYFLAFSMQLDNLKAVSFHSKLVTACLFCPHFPS